MSAALRTPAEEAARLVEMFRTAKLPALDAANADGLVVDETYLGGMQTGNSDLGVPEWTPYAGPRERAPLPGHEHAAPLSSRTWRDDA